MCVYCELILVLGSSYSVIRKGHSQGILKPVWDVSLSVSAFFCVLCSLNLIPGFPPSVRILFMFVLSMFVLSCRSFEIRTLIVVVKCPTRTANECSFYCVSATVAYFPCYSLTIKYVTGLIEVVVVHFAEKYGITPERPHSSFPVEGIVIEAARQLPLYFSRFFVVKVSHAFSVCTRYFSFECG